MKNNISTTTMLLAIHAKKITNHFPLSHHQDRNEWQNLIIEELSFLLLIIYVDLIQSSRLDNTKKQAIDNIVDEWTGVMTGFLNAENTPQNRMYIKQKLNQKSQKYTPIIGNILQEKIHPNLINQAMYKYGLYEQFLDFMLENLESKICTKPQDGIVDAMNFIYHSKNYEQINQEILDEKSAISLSLILHDDDTITDLDFRLNLHNKDKAGAKKRATFLRDSIIAFIDDCIHGKNKNQSIQSNDIDIFSGTLNPLQYFLCAIIPCFLILIINDSLFLFPPNISIPQFSTGTKIRELTNNQEFGLWMSYLLAVGNLIYLQIKRLRDSDSNVLMCLISFIPFFGSLFAISLAIEGQFPSNHGKQKTISANDQFIGWSFVASALALLIFLGIWLTATPV